MPKFAANLSMLYTENPFLQRFEAAAKDGFRAVEYLFPYEWPAEEIAQCLYENGLQQVLFNLPPGDWSAGERGLACLPARAYTQGNPAKLFSWNSGSRSRLFKPMVHTCH